MLNCFFIKEENETSNLLYKLEKTDLKFEWLINSETGERKIYYYEKENFYYFIKRTPVFGR